MKHHTSENIILGTIYYWTDSPSDIYTIDRIDGTYYWRHLGRRPSEKSPNSVETFLKAVNDGRVTIVAVPSYEIY